MRVISAFNHTQEIQQFFAGMDVEKSEDELQFMVQTYDKDNSGEVEVDEFVASRTPASPTFSYSRGTTSALRRFCSSP